MQNYRKAKTIQAPLSELVETEVPVVKIAQGGKLKNYISAISSLSKVIIPIDISETHIDSYYWNRGGSKQGSLSGRTSVEET